MMKIVRILKQNLGYIGKMWIKYMGVFVTLLSVFFIFWTWKDIGIESNWGKLTIIIVACCLALIISVIWTCCLKREKTIWRSPSGKISVLYSDIFKEATDKGNDKERIFVIPVNTCFDTLVDEDICMFAKPLVSPNSLHGKWIAKMLAEGKTRKKINRAIKRSLAKQNIQNTKNIPQQDKPRGNLVEYPRGTVALVRGNNKSTYLLLALTRFDKNNSAYTTVDELEQCVRKLIYFYTTYGQGHELVVPLMGTHLSRAGLTHEDSLKIITSLFRLYGSRIHGKVSVVIYEGDKDKVSLDI